MTAKTGVMSWSRPLLLSFFLSLSVAWASGGGPGGASRVLASKHHGHASHGHQHHHHGDGAAAAADDEGDAAKSMPSFDHTVRGSLLLVTMPSAPTDGSYSAMLSADSLPPREFFALLSVAAVHRPSRAVVICDDGWFDSCHAAAVVLTSYGVPDITTTGRLDAKLIPLEVEHLWSVGPLSDHAKGVLNDLSITFPEDLSSSAVDPDFMADPQDIKTVVVCLGNEPLDGVTPTVDGIARALKSVEFLHAHPDAVVLYSGAPTAGGVSEARMLALIAISRGVPASRIVLEEDAKTTIENAARSAEKVSSYGEGTRYYLLSKSSHLRWAVPIFKKHSVFANVTPLPVKVSKGECVTQMRKFLHKRRQLQQKEGGFTEYSKDDRADRVESRLRDLEAEAPGTDWLQLD